MDQEDYVIKDLKDAVGSLRSTWLTQKSQWHSGRGPRYQPKRKKGGYDRQAFISNQQPKVQSILAGNIAAFSFKKYCKMSSGLALKQPASNC